MMAASFVIATNPEGQEIIPVLRSEKLSIEDYLKKILRAAIYDVVEETPIESAKWLSRRFDNQVYLKREDLQSVFSFKIRGAYNKIKSLSSEELAKGVIAASAGNHAQGLALAPPPPPHTQAQKQRAPLARSRESPRTVPAIPFL